MKKIEAIIRSSRFEAVKSALADIGVRFFTLSEVKGYGLQKTEKLVYRGVAMDQDYIPRLQMDILASADMVDKIIDTICKSARTGEVGDGKITVLDVQKIVRIRTSETDESAI